MPTVAEYEVSFLRRLQRLLDEGDYSSTYKFALLQALADLSVEHPPALDGALTVLLSDVAGKFVEYYWRQTTPYRPDTTTGGALLQNAGRQAAIVNAISRAAAAHDRNLVVFRTCEPAWQQTVAEVAAVIEDMPLWKLQVVGGEADEFLYRHSDYHRGRIRLMPGVANVLRSFYPLVTHLVRGGWAERVRRIGRNQSMLGSNEDLHEFLFGSQRQTLDGFRAVLREYQSCRCFYCRKEARRGDADHFIPWSRYAIDLGHNFVYACTSCNIAKRDYLASVDHLSRWHDENILRSTDLDAAFSSAGLAHDAERSEFVASWAYEQAERVGAHGWIGAGQFERINASWRNVMAPALAVAEGRPHFQLGSSA
jgi:hypothetical protein